MFFPKYALPVLEPASDVPGTVFVAYVCMGLKYPHSDPTRELNTTNHASPVSQARKGWPSFFSKRFFVSALIPITSPS